MRIAVISDIHGNRTAFEAVLADLRQTSPDLILHGGDLADGGSSPAYIIDRIRDLGWKGVLGNTDEVHTRPESLDEFETRSSAPASLWVAVREIAAATRELLGEERVAWLRTLPLVYIESPVALVHASPDDPWRVSGPEAADRDLLAIYGALVQRIAVYGHIHRPFVRRIAGTDVILVNAGAVSQSFDGDPRASYTLIDDGQPSIRRVDYDVEREIQALAESRIPHANWIAKILRTASPQMPGRV